MRSIEERHDAFNSINLRIILLQSFIIDDQDMIIYDDQITE